MLLFTKRAVCVAVYPILLTVSALVLRAPETSKTTTPSVGMTWGVKIPLRDGVHLNATVYQPHDRKDSLPVIFTLTPYIGDSYTDRAMYFANHGYVYALVDVRGRGNSEGEFEPFANEGRDGYDVTEWLAKQPYSNGKVAMWGGSYAGFDQWTVAKEFPPHLSTIVPAAAAHPGVDFPFQYNIFCPYDMKWLTFITAAQATKEHLGMTAFGAKRPGRCTRRIKRSKTTTSLSAILRPSSRNGCSTQPRMRITTRWCQARNNTRI